MTFGFASLKGSIYLEIARGLHESHSLVMYVIVLTLVPSFGIGVIVGDLRFWRNFLIRNSNRRTQGSQFGISDSIGRNYRRKLRIGALAYMLIFMGFSMFQSVRASYVNRAITNYLNLKQISKPYIEIKEADMLDSRFSQISSSTEYWELISRLENVCQNNHLKYQKFDVW